MPLSWNAIWFLEHDNNEHYILNETPINELKPASLIRSTGPNYLNISLLNLDITSLVIPLLVFTLFLTRSMRVTSQLFLTSRIYIKLILHASFIAKPTLHYQTRILLWRVYLNFIYIFVLRVQFLNRKHWCAGYLLSYWDIQLTFQSKIRKWKYMI